MSDEQFDAVMDDPQDDQPVIEPEAEKKPARRKGKAEFDPNATSVLSALDGEINALRQQLRMGEVVALPGMVQRLLPEKPTKGQREKLMEWRSFVVWSEWTGAEWDVVVFCAGIEQ